MALDDVLGGVAPGNYQACFFRVREKLECGLLADGLTGNQSPAIDSYSLLGY